MAVTIDIDVEAKEATGKIGAIAYSLKGLDRVANDIDLDFDADIGDITEEIEAFSEALEGMEVNMNSLSNDMKEAAAELDGAEISVVSDGPDGRTGSGDSSGNDPPIQIESGFEKAARSAQTDGGESGGMSRIKQRRLFSDLFGDNIEGFMSDSDINYQTQGFAPWAKDKDIHLSKNERRKQMGNRVFGDFGYGIEPGSMRDKRNALLKDGDRDGMGGFSTPNISKDEGARWDLPDGRIYNADMFNKMDNIDGLNDNLRTLKRRSSGVKRVFQKITPSMGQVYSVVAAMIPVIIALGTQLLGVAAAMGAVAVAGAAIGGLGLLGHGESMEESFAGAKRQLSELKEEMFNMAQPAMQQFAPIQARMFDAIPEALDGVFEEMEGLTSLEDTLFNLGGALADGLERTIGIINENEAAIGQLSERFGSLIGGGILDFFEWLIQAASDNQEMLVNLGGDILKLIGIAYHLSTVIARVLTAFSPLIDLIHGLSKRLNNGLIAGLLTFISVSYLVAAALSKMALSAMGALSALGILGSGSFIGGIISGLTTVMAYVTALIMELTALQYEAALAAAALSLTGIGLVAVGAGAVAAGSVMSDAPGGGAGRGHGAGGGTYNDHRTYNIDNSGTDDYASQKATEDTIRRVSETNSATTPPSVDSSASNSDS